MASISNPRVMTRLQTSHGLKPEKTGIRHDTVRSCEFHGVTVRLASPSDVGNPLSLSPWQNQQWFIGPVYITSGISSSRYSTDSR